MTLDYTDLPENRAEIEEIKAKLQKAVKMGPGMEKEMVHSMCALANLDVQNRTEMLKMQNEARAKEFPGTGK